MAKKIGSKKVIKISGRRRRGRSARVDNHIVIIAISIAVIIGLVLGFLPNAYKITIQGDEVGAIKDKKVIENAIETVKAQLSADYNAEVKFEEEPELKRYRANKKDYIDPNYLVTYMRKYMNILIEFKEVLVDGESIGIIESEEQLEELKEALKKSYYGDKDVKVEFGKDVKLVDKFAKEGELSSVTDLVQVCTATTPKTVDYEVVTGDTLYGIALKYGVTVDNIISVNEGFTDKTTLKIGDKIKVNTYQPLLPLTIVEEAEVKDEVKDIDKDIDSTEEDITVQ